MYLILIYTIAYIWKNYVPPYIPHIGSMFQISLYIYNIICIYCNKYLEIFV